MVGALSVLGGLLDLSRGRPDPAARTGDIDALIHVLDPDVVLRTDFGTARAPTIVRGAPAVAKQARAPRGGELRPPWSMARSER